MRVIVIIKRVIDEQYLVKKFASDPKPEQPQPGLEPQF